MAKEGNIEQEPRAPRAQGEAAAGLPDGWDARAIGQIVMLAVGFGCMIGFVRMCSLGFAGYLTYEVSSSADAWYGLRACVELGALSLLALAGRYRWFKLDIKSTAGAAVCGIAAAIVFAVDQTGSLGPLVAVLGGVSAAVLMYAWMMLLCTLDIASIVATTLLGLTLAAVVVQGTPLIDVELALVVAVATAFVAGAVLVRYDSDFTFCAPDGKLGQGSVRIPWLTVVMVLSCGFFATVLYGVAEYLTWLYDWRPNYTVFGVAAIAAVVGTVAIMARARGWMHVVWAPLFVLFALAISFSCLPASNMMQIAVALIMATVFSAHFLYWMVFPAILSNLKAPRAFLAGAFLVLSNSSLASLVGDALGSTLPRSMQNLGSVSGLMAIVVAAVFAVTLVLNRQRLGADAVLDAAVAGEEPSESPAALAASAAPADEPAANPADAMRERLGALVDEYGLTPRESEVALYTVQGYSCAYIAEKLVVSNSTVRFHQQNIYRKFEVHSRNELIDRVSAEHPESE